MYGWTLPVTVELNGKAYPICTDYRDILEVIEVLGDPELPECLRLPVAMELFYEDGYHLPEDVQEAAASEMMRFLNGGEEETDQTARPQLIDWTQDRTLIVADINKSAGTEVRALPYLHWWTFLSYFFAIGEGRLSAVVSIREKLRTGKKLEDWERKYYRENPSVVRLRTKTTRAEEALLNEWTGKG